jgi:hypothetical protein
MSSVGGLAMLDNRFRHGRVHFELASILGSAASGIRFETLTLDPDIGPEVALVLTDSSPFAHELKRHVPFELYLKCGGVNTSFGPILFLLWWMPPVYEGKPFALYEQLLNPAHPGTLKGLQEVSDQTHLHLLLIGSENELLDVYEFGNGFGLRELVPICEFACSKHRDMNFVSAKAEYNRDYDLMHLFKMES